MAPLTPFNEMNKHEKTIPIMIIWPHPGKVVHLTGTFNKWKKKIRLQKRFDYFNETIYEMHKVYISFDQKPNLHSLYTLPIYIANHYYIFTHLTNII